MSYSKKLCFQHSIALLRFCRVVIGMSADKDLEKCLSPVLDLVGYETDRIHCVAVRNKFTFFFSDILSLHCHC